MNTMEKQAQLSEAEVRMIMEQILLALDFLTIKKIIHRDIKLDNILIKSIEEKTEFEVRIADFGLSIFTPNNELVKQKCGTPGYVAPEVFTGRGYSYKADIFSLGSLFFNLLTGCFLFSGNTPELLLQSNMICDLSLIKKYLSHTTHHCKDLVTWMLEIDPEDRPTPKEALKHSWFKCDKDILKNLLNMNDKMRKQDPNKVKSLFNNQIQRVI